MNIKSIAQLIPTAAARFGDQSALSRHGTDHDSYTYNELDSVSEQLARGLSLQGIKAGDRIAILAESGPRWGAAFFAAVRAGAVVTPLDTGLATEDLARILGQCQPKLLFASGAQEAVTGKLVNAHREQIAVYSLEPQSTLRSFPSIDELQSDDEVELPVRKENDAAVLTFTSGTMGCSKGVVTTHANLLFQVRSVRQAFDNDTALSTVSILPLCHLYELTAGLLAILYGGGSICYCNSLLPNEIVDAMRARKVTGMVAVPLFLKLFAGSIQRKVEKLSGLRRFLFRIASSISPMLPMSARRVVFHELHDCLGGNLHYFISGGAPLDIETWEFFNSIGLPVYQGYGLAECSPIVTVNCPSANRAGSAGKPMPGVEVRTTTGGEVLTRGPHVMREYLNEAELTRQVIDEDGWLHTGDIGYLDDDGFLFINGREKNIIVLGNGKKVQPEEMEPHLFENPYIEEGCVVGLVACSGLLKGSEEVCAIAVASEEAISTCAEQSRDIEVFVREVIKERARRFPASIRPTRVILFPDPLPRTSTRKIKRDEICRWLSLQELAA